MRQPHELYVVTAISNPVGYRSRAKLYHDFARQVANAGCQLITVEAAFGDRPFEVTHHDDPHHVQLRTHEEIWHKENMLNLGIAHLSNVHPSWEYVAWVDADITFANPRWAQATCESLQHHYFTQMFHTAHDLGPTGETFDTYKSFVACYLEKLLSCGMNGIDDVPGKYLTSWHPGYCWAARREALDHVGGLIDVAILGSADQHMARALIGRGRDSINPGMHANYLGAVDIWQERAERYIRRDIGFVHGTILHHWHGRKKARGYMDRWQILRDHQYDPTRDLKRDAQGLYQLVDHGDERSILLRDRIRAYFRTRNEDGCEL